MAARENQGLQIALIIFVILTLLLSVTTFVFIRNTNYEKTRAETAQQDATKERQRASDMEAERNQYLLYMGGFQATEKKEAVEEAWKKDREGNQAIWGANLPEDQKNYRKLVEGLQGVIRSQSGQLEKLALDLRDAKATYDQNTKVYTDEKAKLSKEKETAVAEYLAERAKNADHVKGLENTNIDLGKKLTDKDKATADLKAQLDGRIADLEKSLDRTQKQLLNKADEVNKYTSEFTVNSQPHGRVVWVNERDKIVHIDLGSDDLLRKRVTFSVFDPSTTDVTSLKSKNQTAGSANTNKTPVSQAKKKGTIEVINITGPHMAECRIIENPSSSLLVPGDLVFTPLWRPGQQEHFALAGFLDIEGDGIDDRARIHDLIRQHGGIIDAETDDKNNMQGAIIYNTRYLIKGLAPSTPSAGYNRITDEAKAMGVETIDLAKFLDMMGYTPKAREDLGATALNPKAPAAGQPASNFRPRAPQSRGNANSAY